MKIKNIKIIILSFLIIALTGCLQVNYEQLNEDFKTYQLASEKYEKSRGIEFKRKITKTDESNIEDVSIKTKNSHEYFLFDRNFNVEEFYSESISELSGNTLERNRYYTSNQMFFHTYNLNTSNESKRQKFISYEDYYNEESIHKLENIIPFFSEEEINNFNIEKDNYTFDISFKAACLAMFDNCETSNYFYQLDNNGRILSFEYSAIDGDITWEYKLEVISFSNFVSMPSFPEGIPHDYQPY